jgi:polar amino acid transport system substrate-binding protein
MRSGLMSMAVAVSALAAGLCAGVSPSSAEDAPAAPLRLCADPTNLPFSSEDPAKPGLYLEIGDAIGKALGRPVTHVWYRTYFGGRAVRTTMLAKQCDATIGLPDSDDFMGPRVIFSKPLFNLGYAVVAPKDAPVASVEALKGKRVAVQFETEPQNIVGPRSDIESVTVLSPDEGMKALADGRADAAFLWAPTAGYLNKSLYGGRFAVTPVDGSHLTYPAAIGFAKTSKDLRDAVDAVLPEVSKSFPALLAKYGLGPDDPPTTSAERSAVIEKAAMVVAQVVASAPPSAPSAAPAASAPAPAAPAPNETASLEAGGKDPGKPAGDGTGEFDIAPKAPPATAELISQGREVFNGTCAHCHGVNAEQGVKKIDLRRLTLRYGGGAHNMFWKTVHEGRPTKGMPTWKGVFSDEQFTDIFAFLSSVQSTE